MEFAIRGVYFFSKETMKVIFETFKVENAEQLRKAIIDGIKGQFEDAKAKRIRLENELKQEQIEFMKMRNAYYKNFGVDISHAGKEAIKQAIKHKNLVDVEVTHKQWEDAYECLTDTRVDNDGKTWFICVPCKNEYENKDTLVKHLIDNHMEKLKQVLVEVLRW